MESKKEILLTLATQKRKKEKEKKQTPLPVFNSFVPSYYPARFLYATQNFRRRGGRRWIRSSLANPSPPHLVPLL